MIDNAIIVLYLIAVLVVGLWAARGTRTFRQFSVSHGSYGSLVIFATLSASFIGGGFSMGNASKVFLFGIANIVALWGFSLKEILVARFIAPRMGRFPHAISTGDLMNEAYGRSGQIVTGIFSVLLCAGIVGAQVGAIGDVFNVFFGLPEIWGILIGCGIVIAYSTAGGMHSVVLTDVVQFCLLAVGIPLALVFGVAQVGGIAALGQKIPPDHWRLFGQNMAPWAFLSLFLTFLLGETLVPPYVQRLLIGRDARATARGTLLSGLFSIPFFAISGAIGLVALALAPGIDSTLAMPHLIKTVLPVGLRGFVIAGVISIVMSSADSFLNGAATGFVNDVVRPLAPRPLSEKTGLRMARAMNLLTGVLAIVFATRIPNVLDILIFAYNFWAPIILVPLAAFLLGCPTSRAGFIAGSITGILGTIAWKYGLKDPAGFDGLVVGVFSNLIAYTIATYLAKRSTKR